jgi:Fe-S-cluster containining protein
MECRPGCGACCISISISSPMPLLPHGKPAGVRCLHLTEKNLCLLWGSSEYPDVCRAFRASYEYCGNTTEEALTKLAQLEKETSP